MEITAILEWFHFNKVIFEYAKSILASMENTPIDIKVSLSQPIFDQTPKNSDPNHLNGHDRMGKKPSHATTVLRGYFPTFSTIPTTYKWHNIST
jgi:hypothetical protein